MGIAYNRAGQYAACQPPPALKESTLITSIVALTQCNKHNVMVYRTYYWKFIIRENVY